MPSLEEPPYPFRDPEYRAYLDGLDEPVTAQFETERGCPLSCAFCSWGTRLPIRRRRQEDVEEGLTYLLRHPNVKAVYIVDANPFIKNDKGLWLTEFLLHKNDTGTPVYFELNPEYIKDPRVIENLGKLSGDELAFGVQSTSEHTLAVIKRKFNRDVYERNVRRLHELNPDANVKFSLIIGLPGDTYDSFTRSLDFVIGLRPADIYVHDLLVLPGSEMYDHPERFGIQIGSRPPHHLLDNVGFPRADIQRAKRVGYYAKLFHKCRWLRDALLALHDATGERCVELYERWAAFVERDGLHGIEGRDIAAVSSEEFDYWTEHFYQDPRRERRLRRLFDHFKRVVEAPRPRSCNSSPPPSARLFGSTALGFSR